MRLPVRTRHARGERHPKAKLTERKVKMIRSAYALGDSVNGIAKDLGVNWKTVRSVLDGKTWAHVE